MCCHTHTHLHTHTHAHTHTHTHTCKQQSISWNSLHRFQHIVSDAKTSSKLFLKESISLPSPLSDFLSLPLPPFPSPPYPLLLPFSHPLSSTLSFQQAIHFHFPLLTSKSFTAVSSFFSLPMSKVRSFMASSNPDV